jgi:hypothetical protein
MDKKILAGDEDGWISCSMVEHYFPSIKLDFVSPRVSTSAGWIVWNPMNGQRRLPKFHLSNLSCKPSYFSLTLPRTLNTTTYVNIE